MRWAKCLQFKSYQAGLGRITLDVQSGMRHMCTFALHLQSWSPLRLARAPPGEVSLLLSISRQGTVVQQVVGTTSDTVSSRTDDGGD